MKCPECPSKKLRIEEGLLEYRVYTGNKEEVQRDLDNLEYNDYGYGDRLYQVAFCPDCGTVFNYDQETGAIMNEISSYPQIKSYQPKNEERKRNLLEQIFLQLEEVGFEGNYSNYEELENKHELIMHRCSVAHKLISELIDTDKVVGNEAANNIEEVLG